MNLAKRVIAWDTGIIRRGFSQMETRKERNPRAPQGGRQGLGLEKFRKVYLKKGRRTREKSCGGRSLSSAEEPREGFEGFFAGLDLEDPLEVKDEPFNDLF